MILLGKQGGCNTAELCDAMQAAIIMLGWDSIIRSATLGVLLATPPDRLHHAATLAMELERLGSAFKAAAYDISRRVLSTTPALQRLPNYSFPLQAAMSNVLHLYRGQRNCLRYL